MGGLKRLASNFKEWLEKCHQALMQDGRSNDALPDFPAEQFLRELILMAVDDKKAGLDPEPLLASLAAVTRRHNKRVAQDVEKHASSQPGVTVNRMNLLRQSYLGRIEAGVLELLFKARIAHTLSRLRYVQGISLRQLERQGGVSFSYLSQIERLSGSLPSSEVLASLDTAMRTSNVEPNASLLQQRGDYDNSVQLLQQEEARLDGAWLRVMGGSPCQAVPVNRNLVGQARQPQVSLGRTSLAGAPGKITVPGRKQLAATMSAGIGDDHEDVDDDGADEFEEDDYEGDDSDNNDSNNNVYGGGRDIFSAAPARQLEALTFELCDYFVDLSPHLQKAVLRLVKDLARTPKNRRKGP